MELTLLTNYNTDLSGFHWLDTTEFESTKGPVYSIQDNLQTKQKTFHFIRNSSIEICYVNLYEIVFVVTIFSTVACVKWPSLDGPLRPPQHC